MASTQENLPKTNGLTLAEILDKDVDIQERVAVDPMDDSEKSDDEGAQEVKEGYCVECEDQPAELLCKECSDQFCAVCFAAQHRKGTRKGHYTTPLVTAEPKSQTKKAPNGVESQKDEEMTDGDSDDEEVREDEAPVTTSLDNKAKEQYVHRSKFIPLRLTYGERKYLRLLEAALTVSEYTDKIDVYVFNKSRAKRIVAQIREICSIISGLLVAADYKTGQELFESRDFSANADFYRRIFELGRRHKIMNPEKMRNTYGKLIYMLQDSQMPEIQDMLGFGVVSPIRTVYTVLEEGGALDMLREDIIDIATSEIGAEDRSRREIQGAIKAKERAIEKLAYKYSRSTDMDDELLKQCLYSIGDNNAFLRTNRDPCEKLIQYLKKYFHPTTPDSGRSLAIRSGRNGARLTHGHEKQYSYCLQSLTLWKEILGDMFELWSLAEDDLLSETISYRLRDTGQGLNRVQPAPKTARKMHNILHRAQANIGYWVGSSVVHMGDHNVPNAHFFLDKYTQVYRITNPICNTLGKIPELMKKPSLKKFVETEYGSEEGLMVEILGDFFRHGFDGSGADNFFDAGSCIDGRLTSAWEWCNNLEKKKYFPVFLLTGFWSFDGEFN
ncbi:hypothetical protein FRC14_005927 [Serendipita sp. 396]|nr:hypothetical protein FRC14_005927 [Serendipita sp. 396]KAG8787023.1 hypothetical protein FRC15_010184 [Serendipita sp. 397]KAG8801846.1 hypothetical protein FRC16_010981 [Serendipita sp. 398]KAG8837363.1 hypothetical protein FRC18_009418 [Serendipita sp. 400]KAG8871365.1 hypothetical protein FRC20_010622 [Serendipita sp. 405]KAG9055109.1 hypothetical protein FS842_003114 [Serendipita sp. 407]